MNSEKTVDELVREARDKERKRCLKVVRTIHWPDVIYEYDGPVEGAVMDMLDDIVAKIEDPYLP